MDLINKKDKTFRDKEFIKKKFKDIGIVNENNIDVTFKSKYKEEDFLLYLKTCKYGIVLGGHESQGFAIEEALSCNVPLIVWNVEFMSQEEGGNYSNIPCTNIEYWDERCGEFFYRSEEFEEIYNKFMSKIDTYKPREYILEHLSPEKCSELFVELINSY